MIVHRESVSPELIEILHALVAVEPLDKAALGGGTSLALAFGHRKSIDIDFFLTDPFDSNQLQDSLARRFSDFSLTNRTAGSLSAITGSIKVDILLHSYPLLRDYTTLDSIQCMSLPDMAAMKINAVTNRGSKKDFSDLLLLHENGIPLTTALDFFCEKYGSAGRFLAIRSLAWFEDAEDEPDPRYQNGWTWLQVRDRMERLAKALAR
jgi:predicted nucleotidyltransferase component of viral defense system